MSQVGKYLQWGGSGREESLVFFLYGVNIYMYTHSMYVYSVVTVSGFA